MYIFVFVFHVVYLLSDNLENVKKIKNILKILKDPLKKRWNDNLENVIKNRNTLKVILWKNFSEKMKQDNLILINQISLRYLVSQRCDKQISGMATAVVSIATFWDTDVIIPE